MTTLTNIYILTWQKTVETIVFGYEQLSNLSQQEFNKTQFLKDYAKKQLDQIEQARPNKEKTAYDQADKLRKEYIDYLKTVIEKGKL